MSNQHPPPYNPYMFPFPFPYPPSPFMAAMGPPNPRNLSAPQRGEPTAAKKPLPMPHIAYSAFPMVCHPLPHAYYPYYGHEQHPQDVEASRPTPPNKGSSNPIQ